MSSKSPHKSRQDKQRTNQHDQQQQENVPPCCAQMRCENDQLRRALRKERERRMFTTKAYRQLLEQFGHLVDFRRVVVAAGGSPSASSSAVSVQSAASSASSELPTPVKKAASAEVVSSRSRQQRTGTTGSGGQCAAEAGHVSQLPPPLAVLSKQQQTIEHHSNWYFVSLERNRRNTEHSNSTESTADVEERRDERMWRMFARSQQRCNAIRDASRARAQIAAGRRAVVADLLTGRRALDSEAIDVLVHTDPSRSVHAFSPSFMREQRLASRRSYEKSPHRVQMEREHQRHFEGAINRVLAHSSATVAKMMATSKGGSGRHSVR